LAQAKGLDELSAVDVAINLDVPVEEARQRMLDRGRGDDTQEAIDRRFALYEQETVPVIDHYEQAGKLVTVDGVGEIDDIFERVVKAVESART
jgi:adenylate kinase